MKRIILLCLLHASTIKNKIILPTLSSFSYNGPNYYDPFNGLKRNWQAIKRSYFIRTNFI
ncbi:hypothetical protein BpHYR1_027598 [Brachionus plicatilis]|uniref:Uncharacterized protein n=1 Tax=Brachionus plicatilis TaxID=10195 RepID=A0A3M7PHX7_BRAPC|nr:hypothetical protein BpHYR1_027598 [Brachionus plicatilis]